MFLINLYIHEQVTEELYIPTLLLGTDGSWFLVTNESELNIFVQQFKVNDIATDKQWLLGKVSFLFFSQ